MELGKCLVMRSSLSLAADGLEAGATPPRQIRGIGRTKGRIVVARLAGDGMDEDAGVHGWHVSHPIAG
jgi:hypothetical protein